MSDSKKEALGWYEKLIGPDQVVELRTVPPGEARLYRSDQVEEMLSTATRLNGLKGVQGIYFSLNPLDPAMLAEAEPRYASDTDVIGRRLLLIDADPNRPAKRSSTDTEKALAEELTRRIRDDLRAEGWPEPTLADSGNGWHLLYHVDLPAEDGGLVERCLKALAARYGTDAVSVDTSVYNPSRICKLYGTWARKGQSTEDRPHRPSRVVEMPEAFEVVPGELLEALADSLPTMTPPRPTARPKNGAPSDVVERASRYLATMEAAVSGQNGSARCIRAAIRMVEFGLDHDTVYRLMKGEYNPRCVPEWSDKELLHKIDDAFEKAEPGRMIANGKVHANGTARANGTAHPGTREHALVGEVERTEIVITTEEHDIVDQAVRALAGDRTIFQRGNSLTVIQRDPPRRNKITRAPGSPQIAAMPRSRLRERLTLVAAWKKRNKAGELVPAHPPDWAIDATLNRGEWQGIRPLEAIVECPVMRPDGSIFDVPGYDEETGLLYEPNAAFKPIPDRPARADAELAADELYYIVQDVPFAILGRGDRKDGGDSHKAAWLAAFLTPMARPAIDGPCPMFPISANVPGAGKGLLAHIIGIGNTGRKMAITTLAEKDDELRKSILAIALAGDRLMLLDNIDGSGAIGGAALDGTLTATTIKDRILGRSKMSPEVPLQCTWYATGNNLQYRGDSLRRIVPILLETSEERPEERSGFAIKGDLLEYVRENRPRLVAAALTILRAYAVAGRPDQGLTPFGSFESWSRIVRDAIHWATGTDPCATRRGLIAADPESLERTAILEGWEQIPGQEKGLTVADAIRLLLKDEQKVTPEFTRLHDVFMNWARTPGALPSPQAIGKKLKAIKGRVCGGKKLESEPYQGTQKWRVELIQRP